MNTATSLVARSKISQCLDLLRRSAREYYRLPQANCTTWSYSTLWPPTESGSFDICGLEIYTTKRAFTDQLNDPVYFQPYRAAVEREALYAKPAEHIAWYLSAGFVARDVNAEQFGGNVVVKTSQLQCLDTKAALDRLTYVPAKILLHLHLNYLDILHILMMLRNM